MAVLWSSWTGWRLSHARQPFANVDQLINTDAKECTEGEALVGWGPQREASICWMIEGGLWYVQLFACIWLSSPVQKVIVWVNAVSKWTSPCSMIESFCNYTLAGWHVFIWLFIEYNAVYSVPRFCNWCIVQNYANSVLGIVDNAFFNTDRSQIYYRAGLLYFSHWLLKSRLIGC